MATTLGLSAYIAAFASYAALALFYIVRGRWGGQGYAFLFATLLTAGWAAVGWAMPWPTSLPHLVDLVHHAASLSWILFLWLLIAFSAELQNNYPRRIRLGWVVIAGLSVIVLSYDVVQLFNSDRLPSIAISLALLVSAAGLSLTETVFRSFRSGDRWGVKYLCLAIGGMFAYDVFFYSDALLYRQIDEALRSTRGFAIVLLVPFFVINIVRAESRHIALSLSAHMVFGSTVLLGAGGYLGVMAVAAYYIRDYGGTWSQALQVIFIFAAILLLCAALLSGTLRSFLRRFMAEHFQRQKFDYRREWRRLLQQISASDSEESLDLRVVKALADLVDSPAGALWYLEGQNFSLAVNWNMPVASIGGSDAAAVIDLFRDRDSVIDLWQKSGGDRMRAKLPDPAAFGESDKGRFLLPLFHHESLMGLVLLSDSRAPRTLDDEDIELVRMASRQAAGYLSEQRSARTLTEAREFEKFNRRYAFVTHDIKNLVSQLSLIVRNFEKHGHRPDFQRDMLATVQSAVERMNHLMDRLKESESDELQIVTVGPLIEKLIAELSAGNAPIRFDYPDDLAALQVRADSRRVDAIMRHLLQNAAESCGGGGKIVVGLRRERNAAVIEVRDTGHGMNAEFVRNELFKPFRSTKRGGMGIGAYQCRTYARELGGDLEAISSVGAGTTMRVTLPLLRDA
jgi:putative PEP-CTERM system histidine kinase